MKRLVAYVIIIILAVVAGLWLMHDPGYVMLAYGGWSMETSLWFLLIIVVIAVIIIWLILRLLFGAIRTPGHLRRWHKGKRSAKAHSLTSDGVLALHEGQWRVAENLLTKGVSSSAIPVVNYLSAARAAQEQLAYDRRDRYLDLALKADKQEKIAVEITRAKLQLEHHQLKEVQSTLRYLKKNFAKHLYVQKLIFEYHVLNNNWKRQLSLIPELRKKQIIDEKILDHQAYLSVKHVMQDPNMRLQDLEALWSELPKVLRNKLKIQRLYIKRLIEFNEHDQAAKAIATALKQNWDEKLVQLFARVRLEDAERQLDMIDGWLRKQESNPIMFLTVGAVALHAKAWAIAKTYAEKSIRLEKTPEAFLVLALAAEALGEDALMSSALKQGLMLQCRSALGLTE